MGISACTFLLVMLPVWPAVLPAGFRASGQRKHTKGALYSQAIYSGQRCWQYGQCHVKLGDHMNRSLVLLAVPALLLTGCSSAAEGSQPSVSAAAVTTQSATATASPTPKATATASASASATTRDQQVNKIYLESLYKSDAALRSADGADLISIGKSFCDMYDGGAKGSDINNYILTAAGWAYTVKQLVAVHGSAVGAFCPEHIEKMGQ